MLEGATSLAGASAVLSVVWPELKSRGEIPHPTTGRTWLLRLGLYKLQRPKAAADDWIWLGDHMVQIGRHRCLMIVGVRLSDLPPHGEALELKHLEPIAILPVEQSNQQIVHEQLEQKARELGAPAAILTDEGSDLTGGVQLLLPSSSGDVAVLGHHALRGAVVETAVGKRGSLEGLLQLRRTDEVSNGPDGAGVSDAAVSAQQGLFHELGSAASVGREDASRAGPAAGRGPAALHFRASGREVRLAA